MAHGQNFNLRLKRDYSVFHNDLEIEDTYGNSISDDHDLSHIYEGYILPPSDETDEVDPDNLRVTQAKKSPPSSHVFGAIRDGVFDGQITIEDKGTYYVERASKYFPDLTNDTFHSVIYHEKHLKDPLHHSRIGTLVISGRFPIYANIE